MQQRPSVLMADDHRNYCKERPNACSISPLTIENRVHLFISRVFTSRRVKGRFFFLFSIIISCSPLEHADFGFPIKRRNISASQRVPPRAFLRKTTLGNVPVFVLLPSHVLPFHPRSRSSGCSVPTISAVFFLFLF